MKFKLTFARSGDVYEDRTIEDAYRWGVGCDADDIGDLQVGQTYVDSDGDTWERVE